MRLGLLAPSDIALPPGADTVDILGISADSRAIQPGFLFAAMKGNAADGARFAEAAVARGAVAILASSDSALPGGIAVPVLRVADTRIGLSRLAARFYPGQPDHLVAVTGTSGKTSVAALARQIFAAAGHAAASIGTIGVVSPSGSDYGSLTTPDPVQLHQILDRLAREGVTHAAMEASSHGLDQHRLDGVRLTAAAFTNLGRDHMDYHPTVEHYLSAKLRLFRDLLPAGGAAVVDADDPHAGRVAEIAAERGQRLIDIGRAGRAIRLLDAVPDGFRQRLALEVFGARRDVVLPLAGSFQVSNALVAAALAIGTGVDERTAIGALETIEGAPGRLELVGRTGEGALVFIDYAHKPDALDQALAALRPMTSGRLVVVFGAGGDRDPGKRPLMGEAAARRADVVIVTDDNPRSEDPVLIRKAVMAGAPGAIEIGDRGEAIRAAVAMLRAGDILCVAGKGHETGQIVGSTTLHFSDHEVVAAALAGEAA